MRVIFVDSWQNLYDVYLYVQNILDIIMILSEYEQTRTKNICWISWILRISIVKLPNMHLLSRHS